MRENRTGNQEWIIQKHWAHKTQDEDKRNSCNKKDEQHGPKENGVDPGARERHSSCFLLDTRHATHIVMSGKSLVSGRQM